MMMTLHEAAAAMAAKAQGADVAFTAVSTDSRAIAPGELFIAIAGERFDGHDYVQDVIARGAAGALVTEAFAAKHPKLPLIVVQDTRLGLGALAAHWRGRFAIPLIGVTGSNGKTTVKEMCRSIFAAQFGHDAVLATEGNLNNDIGLPMTLLRLCASHRAAVIEMGMNHAGEIDYLTRLAAPTVALVNNAQRAHLEGMGTLENVAAAKGEIYAGLTADGVAVFNADDAQADVWRKLSQSRAQISFGLDDGGNQESPPDVWGRFTSQGFGGMLALSTPWGQAEFEIGVPGQHNARNACAAAAACLAAGAQLDAVVRGLSGFTGVKGRLQRKPGRKGALIIDDTYNANPDSMRAALDVVAGVPGKRIFVMGDMGEAGEAAGQFHDEIGGYAKSHGYDRLYCLGELSQAAAHTFGQGGKHFEKLNDLVHELLGELDGDTTVLVKGSRFMRMERVVEAISEAIGVRSEEGKP